MATTPVFDDAYKKLNPEQKKAVDSVEGAVMVVAGPGTGKTQILTLRIANILLKTDTTPNSILALTFTESAVLAMRRRLVEIMGPDGYKVNITTFHGFCNEVIRENPESFRHLANAEPITELEQIQILQQILLEGDLQFLKPWGDPIYYTKSVLSAINDLKKEGITPGDLVRAVKNQAKEFGEIEDMYYDKGPYKGKMKGKYAEVQKQIFKNQELVFIYKQYQETLKKQKYYDYADMIMEVSSALQKDEALLLSIQERYLYILVDEHQDTNSAQNKILELISSYFENPNLFIVGDEKQAIYRFQGASLENFLYFKKIYPDAQLINLTHNYRSTQAVLDASGSLIEKNVVPEEFRSGSIHLMSTVEYPSEKIKITEFNTPYNEMRFIAEDIAQKIKAGTPAREIAVIYRNNKDVFSVVEALGQVGVPFYIESDQDLLSDREVKKILQIFWAIENFSEDVYLTPLLHMDFFEIAPMDIFKVIKFARKQRSSIYEVLQSPEKEKALILESPSSLRKLYDKLSIWQKLSRNDAIENVMITVLQESGMLKKVLESHQSLEKMDRLSSLYQEIRILSNKKPDATIGDFLHYIQLLEDHQLLVKRPLKTPLLKAVRLMTAHRSKGLEFDFVYIIHAFDGHWGNKRHSQLIKIPWNHLGVKGDQTVIDPNDDERRLFYVAMTRAKKSVMISYSKASIDGREQLPSQFIEEIGSDYKEQVEVADFEERLIQKPEVVFGISKQQSDFKDIDFFNFIFLQEGLSVTGLNNYLKCPWRYFYSNLVQIPFVKEKTLIFGDAIHEALCQFMTYMSRVKKLSDTKAKEMLFKYYQDSLKIDPLYRQTREELLEKGKKVLSSYYDASHDKWTGQNLCEYEIRGIVINGKFKINGRIDKIEQLPKSKEVVIYDLKTGKPKSRNVIEGLTKDATGDFKRQILFYKLLVDGYRQKDWVAKKGVIEFVEPDEKGRFHTEEFVFEKNQLDELRELIIKVSYEIVNLDFWDKRCGEKDCQFCDLRDMVNI